MTKWQFQINNSCNYRLLLRIIDKERANCEIMINIIFSNFPQVEFVININLGILSAFWLILVFDFIGCSILQKIFLKTFKRNFLDRVSYHSSCKVNASKIIFLAYIFSKNLLQNSYRKKRKRFTNLYLSLHKKWSFPVKDFFSKCDQIRNFLSIWSHLVKKSLMENFSYCTVFTKNTLQY